MRHAQQQTKSTRGICRVCLCTDEDGCPEGCRSTWTDATRTLCTACDGLTPAEAALKRAAGLDRVRLALRMMREELFDLRCDMARAQQRLDFARHNPI